jgi:glutathione S-transferase
MSVDRTITLFHSPHTRSSGALMLLEELGAPYEIKILNMKAGEQRQPAYLAVNPLGKVPAILDGDALVTEQVAIFIYLADRFPDARLAPAVDDPLRGPYLRWLVYYAACFEPALMDKVHELEPAPMQSPYGDYESMLGVVEAQLAKGPYLLGDTISAADILWGTAFNWVMMFGMVPKRPVFVDYAERIASRPSAIRVEERDAALSAEHEAAASKTQHEIA